MKFVLFKIKEGKLDTWKNWCGVLRTTYKEEALETLKEEGLIYEACVGFEIEGNWYTLGIVQGEEKPINLERELNIKHRAIRKECLQRVTPDFETWYELSIK
jgi:hypothetical protein